MVKTGSGSSVLAYEKSPIINVEQHVALRLFGDWTFVNVVSGLGVMRTCEVVQMRKLF